ncbi:MAG: hypothetical protein N7Q72_05635, partial [Spiroplasma sp. Tabriz.8]|nr:hypothetical protein [Spiroplasma sp. Tabriz.8]
VMDDAIRSKWCTNNSIQVAIVCLLLLLSLSLLLLLLLLLLKNRYYECFAKKFVAEKQLPFRLSYFSVLWHAHSTF